MLWKSSWYPSNTLSIASCIVDLSLAPLWKLSLYRILLYYSVSYLFILSLLHGVCNVTSRERQKWLEKKLAWPVTDCRISSSLVAHYFLAYPIMARTYWFTILWTCNKRFVIGSYLNNILLLNINKLFWIILWWTHLHWAKMYENVC